MNNVHVSYDILLDLDDLKDTGVVEFNYKQLHFFTKITIDFETSYINASIKYSTFGSVNDIGFRAYPYHFQMQLIGGEVRNIQYLKHFVKLSFSFLKSKSKFSL